MINVTHLHFMLRFVMWYCEYCFKLNTVMALLFSEIDSNWTHTTNNTVFPVKNEPYNILKIHLSCVIRR